MRYYWCLLFCFFFFLPFGDLSAQNYTFHVQQFDIKNGLGNNNVSCVFKDQNGFLWIASDDNLQRYDGFEFKSFPLKSPKGRILGIPFFFTIDQDWILIIVSIGQIRNPERVIYFLNSFTGEIVDKEVYFGKGLAAELDLHLNQSNYHFSNFTKDNRLYFNGVNDIAYFDLKKGIKKIKAPKTPLKSRTIELVDSLGNYWVSYEEKGLTSIINPSGIVIDSFHFETTNNNLIRWRSYEYRRVFQWDNKIYFFNLLEGDAVGGNYLYQIEGKGKYKSILKVPDEYTFVGLQGELIWINSPNKWKVFDLDGNLVIELNRADYDSQLFKGIINASGNFKYLISDNTDNFYIFSKFGLNIINLQKNPFTQYFSNKSQNPLPYSSAARGIYAANDSILVNFELGVTERKLLQGGLVLFTKGRPNQYNYLRFANDGRPIIRDSKRNFWVGRESFTEKWMPDLSSQTKILFSKKYEELYEDSWSMIEDKEGCIWTPHHRAIGCLCEGQNRYKDFSYSESGFDIEELVVHQTLYNSTVQDTSSQFWFCSDKGLYIFDYKQKKVVASYNVKGQGEFHLPTDIIYAMHIDADQNRWLATNIGLIFWNAKTKEKRLFNQNDGLSNDVIYSVYEDNYNRLWLSSDYGIMSFHKESNDVQVYLPEDGLGQEEFNRISHFQENDGTIYFGGLNGVTAFHPKDFVQQEKDYARVILKDFEIFDGKEGKLLNQFKAVVNSNRITFHPDDRFFKLSFTLPNIEGVEKNLYAWKIEGVYDDWNYQKADFLQFGELPYGNHTLRIKGQNAGRGWSPKELVLQIEVLKPFYLQTWFILAVILVVSTIAFSFYKWRTGLYKKTQKQLKREIKKATLQIENDKKLIEIQAEELRQLDKVKSRFFANVSHELRTPLTLMLGPIQTVLKSGDLSNRSFTLLKKAKKGGQDLLKLVSSILDLSKMEESKMELKKAPELLFPLMRRITSAFESHAQQKGIKYTFDYKAEKDLQLELDKDKLEIILNNLLSNAMKFTAKEGSVNVKIEDHESRIKITVTDTGRGIHPDDLPHVFNRFYQSRQANAPTEGGTGIGLALSQEFIKLMGGKIWVESELGLGSTFFVEIPRKEILGAVDGEWLTVAGLEKEVDESLETLNLNKPSNESTINSPVPSTIDRQPPTVLIVEDNHSLRDYLQIILSSQYHVLTAENGQAALEILNTPSTVIPQPSIVISDIMMPVMDGFQLLETLKSSDQFRHIPVIMLTARADIQDKLHALRIGVDDYLMKPFIEEELLARIENLLGSYNERMTLANGKTKEETESPRPIISQEDSEWLQNLETQIKKELSNSRYGISQLAYDMAISERQLRRRIKQLTGLSPLPYLKEIRLQKGRQLLEEKRYKTVAQTASAVGFQNTITFSRNFFHHFGKTPTEYLNN